MIIAPGLSDSFGGVEGDYIYFDFLDLILTTYHA
jgi:hypothetical protein